MTQLINAAMAAADMATQAELPVTTTLATTTGTVRDITGIPASARQIVIAFAGVSTSGVSNLRIQVGVGVAPTVTGYNAGLGSGGAIVAGTAGFELDFASATAAVNGELTLNMVNVATNTWSGMGIFMSPATLGNTRFVTGTISLAGVLGMVRLTTANGTDTFDAGQFSVTYS